VHNGEFILTRRRPPDMHGKKQKNKKKESTYSIEMLSGLTQRGVGHPIREVPKIRGPNNERCKKTISEIGRGV
jgi:hypothetical protein